ncbi:LLM class flavin-dependent oxidoreductase [Yinghuangia soli]|uniref:LLM class flavin-dependent oxidoreductase n=1 Tax=Yinghuangia soli TaxID=2908204 RepID=A0AA41U3I8_9ACTN|nr:LLM class flavin-dependent oxidoreductase [Yinghuangia soli]MCF2531856.1 LLM class flavin-dependent oxidoreductase [Yinghuangia soli]
MPAVRDHVHLAVALDGAGRHPAAWRAADTRPDLVFSAAYWTALVREAERGTLDFVRIDDGLGLQSLRADRLRGRLDAVALLARTAPATHRIGLVPAATTTHTEPFQVSTALATLDFVARGRAGWWPKVSATEDETRLFGRKALASDGELLDESVEFVDVVTRLWDSWEDGAVVRGGPRGDFVDRTRLHQVDFEGTYFDVRGPAAMPRPPQGRPVVTMTVDSEEALDVAARAADVLYIDVSTPGQARRLRARAHRIAEAAGRDPEDLRVMADVTVLLRRTAAQAGRARRDLDALDACDGQEGPDDTGFRSRSGLAAGAASAVRRPGVLQFTGTASGLADLVESWTAAGAVDGFTVLPSVLPDGLTRFVEAVVPLLRERGLFRTAYTADTLRGHLGLGRPPSRYARPKAPAEPAYLKPRLPDVLPEGLRAAGFAGIA